MVEVAVAATERALAVSEEDTTAEIIVEAQRRDQAEVKVQTGEDNSEAVDWGEAEFAGMGTVLAPGKR